MKIKKTKNNSGFTLIELMVSVSVFSIVVVMVAGSIFSIFDANRKSQSLRAVMDNLNFSLESMTRDIRFGEQYYCGATDGGVGDCASGDSSLWLTSSAGVRVRYYYDSASKTIKKKEGASDYTVTSPAPDMNIDSLTFWVIGSTPYTSSNYNQPRVIVVIKGHAGIKPTTQSSFTLETTLSQRKLDL